MCVPIPAEDSSAAAESLACTAVRLSRAYTQSASLMPFKCYLLAGASAFCKHVKSSSGNHNRFDCCVATSPAIVHKSNSISRCLHENPQTRAHSNTKLSQIHFRDAGNTTPCTTFGQTILCIGCVCVCALYLCRLHVSCGVAAQPDCVCVSRPCEQFGGLH